MPNVLPILYVYALWKYGSIEVTSGLRSVNSVDEDWDDSDYSGHTRGIISQSTAISEHKMDNYLTTVSDIYSIDGKKKSQMSKGMNIVKNSDGSVKIVMHK